MERLLSVLFSIMLLIATAPPKVATTSGCAYSGGICVPKENCDSDASESSCSLDHEDEEGKTPACPMPICCVCGPCCCLCLVPEQPALRAAILLDETSVKNFSQQNFSPQQVWLAVWKPPAFSV